MAFQESKVKTWIKVYILGGASVVPPFRACYQALNLAVAACWSGPSRFSGCLLVLLGAFWWCLVQWLGAGARAHAA